MQRRNGLKFISNSLYSIFDHIFAGVVPPRPLREILYTVSAIFNGSAYPASP